MNFVPDWAPNIHPMVVHFPIAFLIIAIFIDLLSLIFKRKNWLQFSAITLYFIGAISFFITYLTGRQAADSVTVPALANPVLTEHADWALRTLWFFGIYVFLRLGITWKSPNPKSWISYSFFIVALIGMRLLFTTAEHGAELVYRHGVGVKVEKPSEQTIGAESETLSTTSGIVENTSGSWRWEAAIGAEKKLAQIFRWVEGNAKDLNPQITEDVEKGPVLVLNSQNRVVMFTAGRDLKSIQVDVLLNVDAFKGKVMLVHHVKDDSSYNFVALEDGVMKLGRFRSGVLKILDQKPVTTQGWTIFRAVGDGSHFRGYVNGKLITHGHAKELPPGPVGLHFEGSGKILLKNIVVQSLRKTEPNIQSTEKEEHEHGGESSHRDNHRSAKSGEHDEKEAEHNHEYMLFTTKTRKNIIWRLLLNPEGRLLY